MGAGVFRKINASRASGARTLLRGMKMKDPMSFAGYRTPASILEDPTLSRADKDMALRNWRGAVERVRQVHADEVLRHNSFMEEIDAVLARLAR